MQETQVQSLGQEDPLEKGMAPHSSILAWRIPWTEEPGELQSMGLQRVGHDWVCAHTHTPLRNEYISFLVAQMIKNPTAMQETWVQSLGQEDPLEKGMATHSSILAWRTPWTEEPGGLQSHGVAKSQTWLSDRTTMHNCTLLFSHLVVSDFLWFPWTVVH